MLGQAGIGVRRTPMRALKIVAILAALAASFLVGSRWTPPSAKSAPEASAAVPLVIREPVALPVDLSALRHEIRALRAEVATATAAASARPADGPAPAAPVAPSVEPTAVQAEAIEAAQALVGNAVQERRWSREDADQMRRLLPRMSHEQRMAASAALAVAINSQQVVVESFPPL
jgi:hypothetical protein